MSDQGDVVDTNELIRALRDEIASLRSEVASMRAEQAGRYVVPIVPTVPTWTPPTWTPQTWRPYEVWYGTNTCTT